MVRLLPAPPKLPLWLDRLVQAPLLWLKGLILEDQVGRSSALAVTKLPP